MGEDENVRLGIDMGLWRSVVPTFSLGAGIVVWCGLLWP